jgi:hypothetical protein
MAMPMPRTIGLRSARPFLRAAAQPGGHVGIVDRIGAARPEFDHLDAVLGEQVLRAAFQLEARAIAHERDDGIGHGAVPYGADR